MPKRSVTGPQKIAAPSNGGTCCTTALAHGRGAGQLPRCQTNPTIAPRQGREPCETVCPLPLRSNLVAFPALPAAGAGGSGAEDAARRVRRGLLERLFADNVMDLLLILAQHANQAPFRRVAGVWLGCGPSPGRDLREEHAPPCSRSGRPDRVQAGRLALHGAGLRRGSVGTGWLAAVPRLLHRARLGRKNCGVAARHARLHESAAASQRLAAWRPAACAGLP